MPLDLTEYTTLASKRYQTLVYFASGRLRRSVKQEAPELVQEALMRVWIHRDKVENTRSMVMGAIVQCCLARNKSVTVRSKYMGDMPKRDMPCMASDSYTQALMGQLLSSVPPVDRLLWEEAIESGVPVRNLPVGADSAYRTRIKRTKKCLSRMLS